MVTRALDALHPSRIDHGVRSVEDPALLRRLAEEDVTLTVCPFSNVLLHVCPDLAHVPLRKLLNAGVAVTVNSDDPAYFGGYLTDNMIGITSALGLTADDLYQLSVYAIGGAFADTHRKLELMAELESVFDGE
jgi:adenosine deaminase